MDEESVAQMRENVLHSVASLEVCDRCGVVSECKVTGQRVTGSQVRGEIEYTPIYVCKSCEEEGR